MKKKQLRSLNANIATKSTKVHVCKMDKIAEWIFNSITFFLNCEAEKKEKKNSSMLIDVKQTEDTLQSSYDNLNVWSLRWVSQIENHVLTLLKQFANFSAGGGA